MDTPSPQQDADDGFQRWYVGGTPSADDLEPAPPPPVAPGRRHEGWVAVAGSVAALALLWGFYGVVDDAVVRGAQRQLQPMDPAAEMARASQLPAADSGEAAGEADRTHAVYTLPTQPGASLHYTRWP